MGLIAGAPEAAPRKKPAPITKTYKVSLLPDYSSHLMDGCASVVPGAQHKQKVTIPAKGTLSVKLVGGELPAGGVGDWDLYTLDAKGDLLSISESETVKESTFDKLKGKTEVSIWVCNLIGAPSGTVSYTFTYA